MPIHRQSTSGQAGRKQIFIIILLLVLAVATGAWILRGGPAKKAAEAHGHAHGEEEAGAHEEEAPKGPHGGQRFTEGDFGLELKLVEEGGQARFKAWLYDKDEPAAPAGTELTLSLTRPGGEQQEIRLIPEGDLLASAQSVAEPHVFEATVAVMTPKEPYLFSFEQQEGKVAMSDAQVKAASITLDTSAPATIRSALQFPGEIRFNEDRTAHVVPRVAGVVDSVHANLGEVVRKGQLLAVISSAAVSDTRAELQAAQRRQELARTTYEREKTLWEQKISPEQDLLQARHAWRESEIAVANARQKLTAIGAATQSSALGRFELRAPFDGMVVEKHIALGEAVKEDASVFTISDLATVWAEMSIGARDLQQVRVGERAVVRASAFDASANGTIAYVGSLIGEQTRTARARVVLPNPQGAWRPGLFVNVEVVADEATSAVTVASAALQTVDDKPVVFLKVPGGFVAQPVQLGRSDGKRVEILGGLKPGARYAAAGSFIVKSEQGKGSATHTH